MFGLGSLESLMLWGISGLGLVLGLAPGPEDPVVANVAPPECLFYVSWAGMAAPDPKSANQAEQLLAEPEVQQFAAEVERRIRQAVRAAAGTGRDAGPPREPIIDLVKKAITSPAAFYVTSLQIRGRDLSMVRAGAIVSLGQDAAKVRQTLAKWESLALPNEIQRVTIRGAAFSRIGPDFFRPELYGPHLTWGVYGQYFVLGIGDGEAEALVKRMDASPPAWLTQARQQLAVERPAALAYLNLRGILKTASENARQEGAPPEVLRLLGPQGLGLQDFPAFASVTGLDKTGFVGRSLLAIEPEKGELLAFFGSKPLAAGDLAPIPRDATLAAAVRLDAERLWQTIVTIIRRVDRHAGEGFAAELARVEDQLGFRVREDLLQPLGDVWCVYNSPGEGGLVFTGLTAVVQLRDPKRAAATHEKIIALIRAVMEEGPEVRGGTALKQFTCTGRDVYTLTLGRRGPVFSFQPSWCLTDKELIVALFPQNVKAYLQRGEDFRSLATAPEVAELLNSGTGPVVLGYEDTPELFRLSYPFVQIMAKAAAEELRWGGVDVDMSILPSAPSIGRHLRPGLSVVRRTQAGIETTTWQSLPGGNVGASAPVMVALLLPAVQSARAAACRMQCANNLKQIALAMHDYHGVYKSFPPAYSVDKNGKPLLSWRVLILPFIECMSLYREFRLDQPWDSEHNRKLIPLMPQIYRCPSGRPIPGKTTYLTVRGKDTIFPGAEKITFDEVKDGLTQTILVVEADDQSAVEWTRPDDFVPDPNVPTKGLGGHHPGGFHVALADGSVRFISMGIDPDVLRALFTRDGGEVIDDSATHMPYRPRPVPRKPVPPPAENLRSLAEKLRK